LRMPIRHFVLLRLAGWSDPRATEDGDDQRPQANQKCSDHRRLHWLTGHCHGRRRHLHWPSLFWFAWYRYTLEAFAVGARAVAASEKPRTASAAKIAFLIASLLDALHPRRSMVALELRPSLALRLVASAVLTGWNMVQTTQRRSESIHSAAAIS